MKTFIPSTIIIFLIFVFGCSKKEQPETEGPGYFTFSVGVNEPSGGRTSGELDEVAAVVASIENSSGDLVYNRERFWVSKFGYGVILDPIKLDAGNYQLTELFLLDDSSNVLYASPIDGSDLDYLISNPLPVSFSVVTNDTTDVPTELVSVTNSTPEQFGYNPSDFQFEFIDVFDLPVLIEEYDPINDLYVNASGSLIVFDSLDELVNKQTNVGVTYIKLRDDMDDYQFKVFISGYDTIESTFSISSLETFTSGSPLTFRFGSPGTKCFKVRQILKFNAIDNTNNLLSSYGMKLYVPATETSEYKEIDFEIDESGGCVPVNGTSMHGFQGIPANVPFVAAVFYKTTTSDTIDISVVSPSSYTIPHNDTITIDCDSATCTSSEISNCETTESAIDLSTADSSTCNTCWLPECKLIPFENLGAELRIVGIPIGNGDVRVKWVFYPLYTPNASFQVFAYDMGGCSGTETLIYSNCANCFPPDDCQSGDVIHSASGTVSFKLVTYNTSDCTLIPINEDCSEDVIVIP